MIFKFKNKEIRKQLEIWQKEASLAWCSYFNLITKDILALEEDKDFLIKYNIRMITNGIDCEGYCTRSYQFFNDQTYTFRMNNTYENHCKLLSIEEPCCK